MAGKAVGKPAWPAWLRLCRGHYFTFVHGIIAIVLEKGWESDYNIAEDRILTVKFVTLQTETKPNRKETRG